MENCTRQTQPTPSRCCALSNLCLRRKLVLNMLAEVAATDISVERQPEGFSESAEVAKEGAKAAKVAPVTMDKRCLALYAEKNTDWSDVFIVGQMITMKLDG